MARHNTPNGQKCGDSQPPFKSTVHKGYSFPCSAIIPRIARRRSSVPRGRSWFIFHMQGQRGGVSTRFLVGSKLHHAVPASVGLCPILPHYLGQRGVFGSTEPGFPCTRPRAGTACPPPPCVRQKAVRGRSGTRNARKSRGPLDGLRQKRDRDGAQPTARHRLWLTGQPIAVGG